MSATADLSHRRYTDALLAAYRRAEEACAGPIDRLYRIAGHSIHLRFAGAALLPHVGGALCHLGAPPVANPDLTIHLFDSASTGVDVPAPPWPSSHWYGDDDAPDGAGRLVVLATPAGTTSVVDVGRNLAVVWIRDARQFPVGETGSPLVIVFNAWMQPRGYQLIHAGAVGTAAGGVLLVGRGGTGKSTTALACLDSPLRYLSDDYCLFAAHPQPHACGLYNTGRLEPSMLRRLPRLAGVRGRETETGKMQFALHELCPEKLVERFPIRAILAPQVGPQRETSVRPITPIAALRALAPSTIFQLPGAAPPADTLARLATLVRHTPCYALHAGSDLAGIPAAILDVLGRTI